MKKLFMLLVIAIGMSSLTGCATLVETPVERDRRICNITEINLKGMVSDWDTLWLADRNTLLTEWHPHVGR